jgi:hypothetical protein
MSQYNIIHTCGHVETLQLYGPGADRDRRAAWLRGQPCLSCRQSTSDNNIYPMPTLVGSPKQTEWAKKIRATAIKYADSQVSQMRLKLSGDKNRNLIDLLEQTIITECRMRIDASWWIEHRSDSDLYTIIADRIKGSRDAYEDIANS